ncbi:hypothetical protein F4777DRAFT_360783 [Nemania sp. FL0916]|nr:hypothetical protein F4777DRAFT_360783 [Nemania sp. FL0916]
MAITEPYHRHSFGRTAHNSRVNMEPTMAPLPYRPASSNINIHLDLRRPWSDTSSSSASLSGSRHRPSLSAEYTSQLGSPLRSDLPSPLISEKSFYQPTLSLPFNTGPKQSTNREYENKEYDNRSEASLFSFRSSMPYHRHFEQSHAHSRQLRTPSTTPEPREGSIYSRRPSLLPGNDPITAKLNEVRAQNNKGPLPALGAFADRRFHKQAERKRAATQAFLDNQRELHRPTPPPPPPPPHTIRKRRVQPINKTHCNIKYNVEELDYIRYQRVDLGLKWTPIEINFNTMFPLSTFPRLAQGLQGVNYRQNKALPNIKNGQLVFMVNGHVEPTCVQTRHQSDTKHMYSLIWLYPERAMNYVWIPSTERERAKEINKEREKQKEMARLEATNRGTYVEKLPSDVLCGCCPGEDRERDKTKRVKNKPAPDLESPSDSDFRAML